MEESIASFSSKDYPWWWKRKNKITKPASCNNNGNTFTIIVIVQPRRHLRDISSSYSDCNGIWIHNYLIQSNWLVWLNGGVFIYELNGCGFQSHSSPFIFRYCACSKQGVPWHSEKFRVKIHSMHMYGVTKICRQPSIVIIN